MKYRICKQFEIESGHQLSKHRERCRFPHGHTRKVEIVVEADRLDANDMVVDFKALRLLLEDFIDRWDHAMAVNVDDPLYPALSAQYGGADGRIIPYVGEDPTSEVMARQMFEFACAQLEHGGEVTHPTSGATYPIPAGLRVIRLRLWETSSSWAEVAAEA